MSGERARGRTAALAVAVVTAAVWLLGIRGPYHFDDALTPVDDPASQSLGAWISHLDDTLRPTTKLTYAVEASLGLAASPPARRVTSVVIHAVAAALLCTLVLALVPSVEPRAAAALALVWGVHPVHAEAVLALAGRSAGLAGMLVLAAVLAHVRDRRLLAACLLFAAGLARETAICALLAIVAAELAADRTWRARARRLAPAVIAAGLAIVWVIATPRARALADYSFFGRPVIASALHQVAAVPIGLSLYLRPWALSIDHGTALPPALAILGLALYIAAALGLVTAARRRSPAVAVGCALWLAALLPTQSIIPKLDALAERPLSLALAGLILAAAPLAVARRRLAIGAACAIAAGAAVAAVDRGQLYRSDLLLWADAAAKSQTNPRPHMNFARELHLSGRDREALDEVERARAIDPYDPHLTEVRDDLRAALAPGGVDAR